MKKNIHFTYLILLLLSLSGCVSNTPIQYYVLTATPSTTTTPIKQLVTVGPVTVREYLNRPELVIFDSDTQLNEVANSEWGEPVLRNVSQVLVRNLGQRLGEQQVVARTGLLAIKPDYQVAIDINELAANRAGQVKLRATWNLLKKATNDGKITVSQYDGVIVDNTVQAQVDAQSALLGLLADDIAEAIAASR